MQHWYTLYTKPNAEHRVSNILQGKGIKIYLPEITLAGSDKPVTQPLFPCYLFMHTDLNRISTSTWKWTSGLQRVVAFGGQPVIVPPAVIQLIKQNIATQKRPRQNSRSTFQKHDVVRITEGPFRDMLAVFDKHMSANERVQVLLTMLGRTSRVQVDVQSLEKVSAARAKSRKRPRRTRGRGRHINNARA